MRSWGLGSRNGNGKELRLPDFSCGVTKLELERLVLTSPSGEYGPGDQPGLGLDPSTVLNRRTSFYQQPKQAGHDACLGILSGISASVEGLGLLSRSSRYMDMYLRRRLIHKILRLQNSIQQHYLLQQN